MTSPRVSDHALLRFLDLAGGLAVEQLRAQLEASLDRAGAAAEAIGGGDYLITADGLVYVVRDGTVVTVLPERNEASRARTLADRGGRG